MLSAQHSHHIIRTSLITAAVILSVLALVLLERSSLVGSLTNIAAKGDRTVTRITFDQGEISETLPVNNINIILTPDAADIAHGARLSDAMTAGKLIYGYKYSSRSATQEIAAKVRADNGEPVTFSQLFPGQFFTSDNARSASSFIPDFESQKNISFLPLAEVTLERNGRYVMVTMDETTTLTVRGLGICGNRTIEGLEQCDDGNVLDMDGCSKECKEGVVWSSYIQGPGTWDEVSGACNGLKDRGLTQWRLPSVPELIQLERELLRAGIVLYSWTFTRAPNYPLGEPDVWMIFDKGAERIFPAFDYSPFYFGLCVEPVGDAYICEDSDRIRDNAPTLEYDTIFVSGTVHAVAGPHSDTMNADVCFSSGSLLEYYCGGGLYSRKFFCPNGYGCTNGACNRELPAGASIIPTPQCQDGIDNDRDGVTDYYDSGGGRYHVDPGCSDAFDEDESDGTTACQDTEDNDGDGLVDAEDPGCWMPIDTEEEHRYSEPIVLNTVSIGDCGADGRKLYVDFASNIFDTVTHLTAVHNSTAIPGTRGYYGLEPLSTSMNGMDPALVPGLQVKLCHGNNGNLCSNIVTVEEGICR